MKLKWIMLAMFYIPSSVLVAQPLSSTEQQKIDFLKSELVNSNCLFERNGKQYNAKRHLSILIENIATLRMISIVSVSSSS